MKPKYIKLRGQLVKLPHRPNFLITRQGSPVPVGLLSKSDLREIAAAWTRDFVARGA